MQDAKSDLQKIIKRLEIIKSLVLLEEDEEIELHISRLQKLDIQNEVLEIIIDLQNKSFRNAISKIENFLTANNEVAFYIDPEIEALRFEAKGLEKKIQLLSEEKAELDKLIFEFGVRHNQELGELILKILEYRKEQTKGTPQEEDAKKDYENFNTDYEATKNENIESLNEEELKELKNYYRRASKLCHPDVVNDAQKDLANKIFIELNEAYEKNNLTRVYEILADLENGTAFISKADVINEKQALQTELERLRIRLTELNNEINTIRTSNTYSKLNGITDWDEYFQKTKEQLQEQLKEFENGLANGTYMIRVVKNGSGEVINRKLIIAN